MVTLVCLIKGGMQPFINTLTGQSQAVLPILTSLKDKTCRFQSKLTARNFMMIKLKKEKEKKT